jgi:hypothetical protein
MLHEEAPSRRLARPEHAAWLRVLLMNILSLARRLFNRLHTQHVGCELVSARAAGGLGGGREAAPVRPGHLCLLESEAD